MNIEEANHIILKPYITEKTFALVENQSRICFLVKEEATKPKIVEAITLLYKEDPIRSKYLQNNIWQKSICKIPDS